MEEKNTQHGGRIYTLHLYKTKYYEDIICLKKESDYMDAAEKLPDRYTYVDYCNWPENERWELIDGEAFALAAPNRAHQTIQREIFGQLFNYLRDKSCEVFVAPFTVRLNADKADDTVVEPDILVVCDSKKLEDGKGVVGAPDFIIEVISPSTSMHDKARKFKLYQQAGVKEYWIIDPEDKLLTAYSLHNGKYLGLVYFPDDTAVPVSTLEGCTIDLSDVFMNNSL